MYVENRNFNIAMSIIIVILSISLIYLIYAVNEHEKSRVYFNLNDIENITWTNGEDEFFMNNNKATLILDSNTILDNKKITFDTATGEIKYNGTSKIYIRSVSGNVITIWYEEAEYRLNKKIETR